MFYTLIKHGFLTYQSAQGPIYIIDLDMLEPFYYITLYKRVLLRERFNKLYTIPYNKPYILNSIQAIHYSIQQAVYTILYNKLYYSTLKKSVPFETPAVRSARKLLLNHRINRTLRYFCVQIYRPLNKYLCSNVSFSDNFCSLGPV